MTDYAKPTGNDWWGENSINVLGDSISFGVGTSNSSANADTSLITGGIPEQSYISYVKKAVQAVNGGKMNYGFTSAYPTCWPGVARSEELHGWPDRTTTSAGETAWVCDNNDDGNRLTSVAMTSVTPWSVITYRLRKDYYQDYTYFCVYYDCVADGASFTVANDSGGEVPDISGVKQYISTKSDVRETKRTAFFRLSDCPTDSNGIPKIMICHDGTTSPVSITGIGYYKELPQENNADGYVTFNSFTRGGISLINMSDTVLSQAAAGDTLILGLGYNDSVFNTSRVLAGEFTTKINYLIAECNKNGTNVIVNNYVWDNPAFTKSDDQIRAMNHVRSELQRLARETGGIHVDQQALCGDAIIDDLNNNSKDMVHPTGVGHKLMAQHLVAAMGLDWTEDWT